jgi:hypothetical protein
MRLFSFIVALVLAAGTFGATGKRPSRVRGSKVVKKHIRDSSVFGVTKKYILEVEPVQ